MGTWIQEVGRKQKQWMEEHIEDLPGRKQTDKREGSAVGEKVLLISHRRLVTQQQGDRGTPVQGRQGDEVQARQDQVEGEEDAEEKAQRGPHTAEVGFH